jgi:uridine kinase
VLVYVTGISGSGKSAVLEELRSRSLSAYGVDEDGYGRWLRRGSGEEESLPRRLQDFDIHQWMSEHDWVLDVGKIAELRRQSDERAELVFLCGVAAGDSEAWEYFDLVCSLVIDDETIKTRITRRSSAFGEREDELAEVLKWNAGYAETYRQFGAVIIDATQPLASVVDEVIAAAEARK